MGQILTIASLNTQNPYMRKDTNKDSFVDELIELIQKEKIDILCCQEMLKESTQLIQKKQKNLQVIGGYRYGTNFFSKNMKILKKYNESTPIITSQHIIKSKTYRLPWMPKNLRQLQEGIFKSHSLTPRILTESLIQLDNQYIVKVLNTHLEKRIQSIKKRQMKKIQRIIKHSTYPVILTGDFNSKINQPIFQEFVKNLEKFHIKRVEWNQKTWKKDKQDLSVDHIFISDQGNFKIIDKKRIDNTFSDHYMILVKLEIK